MSGDYRDPIAEVEGDETICPTCEGGGWVQVYSPHPPAFEVCSDCYNPGEVPCP